MDRKRFKKAKHNHSRNLEIVLQELRSNEGGAQLEELALKCGVSTRQIYRYLNELQNMGYEILKNVNHVGEYSGGYILRETEEYYNEDLHLINLLGQLDQVKNEIQSASILVKEILIRYWMIKMGIFIPLTVPVLFFDVDDAIRVSSHTMVYSAAQNELYDELRIKVSAKVVNSVMQSLGAEITSKQRLRDGYFNIQLKTSRAKDMIGLLTQWGSDVEVIEPGWLKHKMLENCKAILHANRLKKADRTNLFSTGDKYLISF